MIIVFNLQLVKIAWDAKLNLHHTFEISAQIFKVILAR